MVTLDAGPFYCILGFISPLKLSTLLSVLLAFNSNNETIKSLMRFVYFVCFLAV